MRKIVFTGGGTAGHIMPNIALMKKLLADNSRTLKKCLAELHYIGQPNSMEETLVKQHFGCSVKFHQLACTKLVRSFSLKTLCVPFRLCKSKKEAKQILNDIKPDLIFSKGGFVALPVMLAAKNTPLILHESDFSFGLANKLALKKCTKILTAFKNLADKTNNAECVGAPIREEIFLGDKNLTLSPANTRAVGDGSPYNNGKHNLLIFGGSLGARAINCAITKNLDQLLKQFNIVHIVGKGNLTNISKPNYIQLEFAQNIPDYYDWADFSITRGGANALFELIALKIPSLVIPLPKGVSRGDQVDNANYFKSLGYIKVFNESDLDNNDLFLSAIQNLVKNKDELKERMKSAVNVNGTQKILDIIKMTINT